MKALLTQSILVLAAATGLLSGCAPLAPNVDNTFGSSVSSLKAQQTIDVDASKNNASAVVDGKTGKEIVDRYYKSYSVPTPPQNVFTIGLGAK